MTAINLQCPRCSRLTLEDACHCHHCGELIPKPAGGVNQPLGTLQPDTITHIKVNKAQWDALKELANNYDGLRQVIGQILMKPYHKVLIDDAKEIGRRLNAEVRANQNKAERIHEMLAEMETLEKQNQKLRADMTEQQLGFAEASEKTGATWRERLEALQKRLKEREEACFACDRERLAAVSRADDLRVLVKDMETTIQEQREYAGEVQPKLRELAILKQQNHELGNQIDGLEVSRTLLEDYKSITGLKQLSTYFSLCSDPSGRQWVPQYGNEHPVMKAINNLYLACQMDPKAGTPLADALRTVRIKRQQACGAGATPSRPWIYHNSNILDVLHKHGCPRLEAEAVDAWLKSYVWDKRLEPMMKAMRGELPGQLTKRIAEVCHFLCTTMIAKHIDYGNAGKVPTLLPDMMPWDGILVRLSDKLDRFKNLLERKEEVADEPIDLTALDAAGYFILFYIVHSAH